MIFAGDFRKGITFEMDDQVYQVLDFQHVKPGKGAAFVRTKYKNIVTNAIQEKAFNPSERFPKAHIETKEMQYLYDDGDLYYFMDNESYEQIPLSKDKVEEAIMYIKPNDMVTIRFFRGDAFSVEPPNFVTLQVIETEPGFKGDTAQNTFKPAKLETGAVVQVPLFIEEGEVIRIDTRTGEYMSRV